MNARHYYLMRAIVFAAVVVALPILVFRTGQMPDTFGIWFGIVFWLIFAGLLVHAIRRFRSLEPDAQINYGPPPEVVRAHAAAGSRRMPVFALGAGALGLIASYFFLLYTHRGHPMIVLICPAIFLLGLAGTIHPPIFYAMRNDVGEVEGGNRAIAYFLLITGFAIGGFCAWWVFWR